MRTAWLTAANFGAGFVDAALQFGSIAGQTLFMSSMGATTAGGVGQLAFQGGATFDDRTGRYLEAGAAHGGRVRPGSAPDRG